MATLAQIIQRLSFELQDYAVFTTDSAGSTTSEAVCSDLIDSTVSAKEYGSNFLYALDGAVRGQQRVVTPGGFAPDTGALTTSSAFTSIPQSGVNFLLGSRFPLVRVGKRPGLREFINHALEVMAVEDRISVSGVTGQSRYNLPISTQWWINERNRIVGIAEPYPNSTDTREIDAQFYDIIWDGEVPQLQLRNQYVTGDTFELVVMRPANSRLRMNGHARAVLSSGTVGSISVVAGGYYTSTPTVTFSGGGGSGAAATATVSGNTITSIAVTSAGSGYTSPPTISLTAGEWQDMPNPTDGLVTTADETYAPIHDVIIVAKEYAYLSMMQYAPSEQVAYWSSLYQRQQLMASVLKFDQARPSGIARVPMYGSDMSPAM